ncbi:MAG TPA: polyphosphate kinase, partial [Armatimonadetes bacterium]|nr:polyphosphate kinase [Armatimonadota bacterium]
IPANRKWYRNLVISELLAEVLGEMDPQLPKADFDPSQIVIE